MVLQTLFGKIAARLNCSLLCRNGCFLKLVHEAKLQSVPFLFFIPCFEVFAFREVDLNVWNLEAHCLIGLCRHQQVLVLTVRLFHPLLERGHYSVPRLLLESYLRKLEFEQKWFLLCLWILLLHYLVARLPNFFDLAALSPDLLRRHDCSVALLSKLSPMQIGLMFLSRSVRKITVLCWVQS